MLFWTAAIIIGAAVFGIWSVVSAIIPDSDLVQSSDTKYLLIDEQREQLINYSSSKLTCASNLSYFFSRDTETLHELNPLAPNKTSDSIEILGSLDDTVVVQSRLSDFHSQYYYHYQDDEEESPFVILLHDFNEFPSTYIENSLSISKLFFDRGYNLVAPYIYSDPNWINTADYRLSLSGESIDWIVISKVQSIMDFLDYQYNDNNPGTYIVYGKGWGSIIGRGTGSVDSRVSLVVSEDFPADPIRDYSNGQSLELESSKFIGLNKSKCSVGSLQSFLDLIPTPHILINSERFRENGNSLSVLVNKEYEKVGNSGFVFLEYQEDLISYIDSLLVEDLEE